MSVLAGGIQCAWFCGIAGGLPPAVPPRNHHPVHRKSHWPPLVPGSLPEPSWFPVPRFFQRPKPDASFTATVCPGSSAFPAAPALSTKKTRTRLQLPPHVPYCPVDSHSLGSVGLVEGPGRPVNLDPGKRPAGNRPPPRRRFPRTGPSTCPGNLSTGTRFGHRPGLALIRGKPGPFPGARPCAPCFGTTRSPPHRCAFCGLFRPPGMARPPGRTPICPAHSGETSFSGPAAFFARVKTPRFAPSREGFDRPPPTGFSRSPPPRRP